MRTVLTTSPRAEGDLERGGLPFLGIGYIGSWLKKYGYEVKITDKELKELTKTGINYLKK